MKHYYVNKQAQSNGDHEVHTEDCKYIPEVRNREYLGYFTNCQDAIKKAKSIFPTADGCFFCSRECHKQ